MPYDTYGRGWWTSSEDDTKGKRVRRCIGRAMGQTVPATVQSDRPQRTILRDKRNGNSHYDTEESMKYIGIKQATEQGYIPCQVGGVADFSYPTSKVRRGRVQKGGGYDFPYYNDNNGSV